jgi:hypothetical protein
LLRPLDLCFYPSLQVILVHETGEGIVVLVEPGPLLSPELVGDIPEVHHDSADDRIVEHAVCDRLHGPPGPVAVPVPEPDISNLVRAVAEAPEDLG